MNPLKARQRKRSRRHAQHEAKRINKTADVSTVEVMTIVAIRAANARGRKFMRKRKLITAPHIALTAQEAFAKVPASWTGAVNIVFPPGTYGLK